MSVYFAQVGRYVKVGYSADPEWRVANLFQSGTRYTKPLDCPTSAVPELLLSIPGGRAEHTRSPIPASITITTGRKRKSA